MSTTKKIRLSISVPEALYKVILNRAKFNLRSAAGEVLFLLETGLTLDVKNIRAVHKMAVAMLDEQGEA